MIKKPITQYYETAQELLEAVEKVIIPTDVVADIGCGIVPMNYFRPKLHLLIEPWEEYNEVLLERFGDDKSVVVLRTKALDSLKLFNDNSIDSIFLLDVIEHLEKEEGKEVLKEIERVTRQQAVIFTPLGFMPQHAEPGEKDGWGLSGTSVQEHLSGWLPNDFPSYWSFYICETFHQGDYKGDKLSKPYGAFFAICNFENKQRRDFKAFSDFRKELPSEKELNALKIQHQTLKNKHDLLLKKYNHLSNKFYYKIEKNIKNIIIFFRKKINLL